MSIKAHAPAQMHNPIKLELGRWTPALIGRVQQALGKKGLDAPERAAHWARLLLASPFKYESAELELSERELLVRLEGFDCITLVYNVIALAGSVSFQGYVSTLARLRYRNYPEEPISNRRINGTFFDFACEALLVNRFANHILCDVTTEVARDGVCTDILLRPRPLRRDRLNDANESIVYPRFPRHAIQTDLIKTGQQPFLIEDEIRDGDIVLFSKFLSQADPRLLVSHAGIAMRIGGILSLIHASRHYVIGAASEIHWPPTNRWHPGVYHLCRFMGESSVILADGVKFYGYDASHIRPLSDYARENFSGLKVLRLRQEPCRSLPSC